MVLGALKHPRSGSKHTRLKWFTYVVDSIAIFEEELVVKMKYMFGMSYLHMSIFIEVT